MRLAENYIRSSLINGIIYRFQNPGLLALGYSVILTMIPPDNSDLWLIYTSGQQATGKCMSTGLLSDQW